MNQIQYIGAKELNADEKRVLDKLSAEYHEKISRSLDNVSSIVIHIKNHGKGGKKVFGINARVVAPTHVFESNTASGYDLAKALHQAFNDLEKQIQHRLRTDSQRPKSYE